MRKFQILYLFLLLVIVSCSNSPLEEFVLGKNFVKDQATIIKIDTLTLQSSTVKEDSIRADSPSRLMVGTNYNPFSGYKSSSTYLTLKFDGSIDRTKFVYDSLCLVLSYDTNYTGDTTVTQTLGVYQLLETMKLNKKGYISSINKFKYGTSALGIINFKPTPRSKKQLNIKLSDEFGNKLAEMIKLKKEDITSQENFLKNVLNGIVIKPESNNVKGAVVRFRTADITSTTGNKNILKPEMRLYYHLDPNPDELKNLYYKFTMNSNTEDFYFNQISGDSKNTVMEGIEDSNNELNSNLTNNQTIIQSGVQLFTKLKIPHLENLPKSVSNPAVVGSIIRLYPIKGTYNKASELPDTLYIYSANKRNLILNQVTLPGESTKYVYATLGRDENRQIISDEKDRIYYEADVTSFVEAELQNQTQYKNSLFFGYGYSKSKAIANQVILGGVNSGKYSPALSVFYYHN